MLRKVKELTEDIEVADDAELQALRAKLEKLETKNVQLAEERKKALVAANRANKIALEVLERSNKSVVSESETKPEPDKKDVKVKAEDKKIEESKKTAKKKEALKEEVKTKKTKQAKPKTTRRTLTESQSPKTAKKPVDNALGIEADNDILDIAQTID